MGNMETRGGLSDLGPVKPRTDDCAEVLREVRHILGCPEGHSIILWAEATMREYHRLEEKNAKA